MADLHSLPFPPGFRFQPTEEELLAHYLRDKHRQPISLPSSPLLQNAIQDLDIYSYDPRDLPQNPCLSSADEKKRCYFFMPRVEGKKAGALKRKAKGGYWKRKGGDRTVVSGKEGAVLGMKKTFVFYRGRFPDAQRTGWFMNEYELADSDPSEGVESFALCYVFLKSGTVKEKHPSNSHDKYISTAADNHDGDLPSKQHVKAYAYGIGVADENVMLDELSTFLMALTDKPDGLLAEPVDKDIQSMVRFANGLGSDAADVIDEPFECSVSEGDFIELNDLRSPLSGV